MSLRHFNIKTRYGFNELKSIYRKLFNIIHGTNFDLSDGHIDKSARPSSMYLLNLLNNIQIFKRVYSVTRICVCRPIYSTILILHLDLISIIWIQISIIVLNEMVYNSQ